MVCADCGQLHYFRRMPFQDGSQVRYNHPQAPEPAQFVTEFTSCLSLQENDPETVKRAFDNTTRDSRHAAAMKEVGEPDCTFCEKLHASEADASAEASAYTNENFPDLNDDPPLL